MLTTSTRRALVALATATALLPAAPALAQTATPAPSATPSPTTTPAPTGPSINVDRTLVDYGQTIGLNVFGRVGATVQLFGNGRQIRTATIGQFEGDPQGGVASFTLQPGDRTLFYAVVEGRQSASVTVEVRRTVTIGIEQRTRGTYTFTGAIARAEAGVQVTIARLDDQTKRVTGVASTRTTADGRYEISTSLPQGLAGYYALTGVSTVGNLQAGRSRLYGLLVNTVPGTGSATQSVSLDVGRSAGDVYVFSGAVSPGRSEPVTLARVVDGRLVGVAGGRSAANGGYVLRVAVAPGTSYFQVVTGTAKSRVYGLVVPGVQSDPAERDDIAAGS